ncbi:MAG: trypsin-like peptidase domain-containing protein [Spirochaetia bacterium]|jgi:S1-C subfamily serine protease|nr:trypsin-like peptidase domain-containing protein [Spirochaetia bacterium]
MKLYSRGQVFFYSVTSAVVLFLFLIGFGIIRLTPQQNTPENKDNIVKEDDFIYQTQVIDDNLSSVNDKGQYQPDELENIKIYQQLNEAVVNISIEVVTLNWFLEPVPQKGGSGSGAIIDKRGFIITNKHVVENAYKVFVTFADGSQFDGNVIGIDSENDLAVVKIDPGDRKLVTIPMGDSSKLLVGQKVLAIGNPFGYERTLTTGVISGLGRPVKPSSSSGYIVKDMIQTDASINPGNSGGPMINSSGEMIGINTMIYSPSGGSIGIGFAVPINTARRVVPDLIKYGKVRRGWIDIEPVQIFPELVRYASLPVNKGILVSKTAPGSNAEKAGLRGGKEPVRYGRSTFYIGGDIIIEADSFEVNTLADFYSALEDNKPGDIVKVKIIRGKRELELSIELSERQKD